MSYVPRRPASERRGRARQRWIVPILALLLALLLAAPSLAQGERITIDDPDGLLANVAAVREAARRLANEGADVVVIVAAEAGATNEEAQGYLDRRLGELGIAPSSRQLGGNQIVFYMTPQPGYAGIYYVPRYQSALDPALQQIIREEMGPRFNREDYDAGLVAGIDAVRTRINPPTNWVLPGVIVAGGAGAVAVSQLRKRRAASEMLAAARQRMEEAREAAGIVIADVGRRLGTAQEKAQYDAISYAPADAQRVAALQQQGEAAFARAQAIFDAAEESSIAVARPTAQDHEQLVGQYREAEQLAKEAGEAIARAEQLRSTLDAAGGPSTGETRMLNEHSRGTDA